MKIVKKKKTHIEAWYIAFVVSFPLMALGMYFEDIILFGIPCAVFWFSTFTILDYEFHRKAGYYDDDGDE